MDERVLMRVGAGHGSVQCIPSDRVALGGPSLTKNVAVSALETTLVYLSPHVSRHGRGARGTPIGPLALHSKTFFFEVRSNN